MQRKDHTDAWPDRGSIDDVESPRSQEQRTATSEQRIGWVALGARAIERHGSPHERRNGHEGGRRKRRGFDVDRSRGVDLALRCPACDVGNRTATRGAHRRVRRRLLLRLIGFRRAATGGPDDPVVRASVPRCRRYRRHQDQGKQDHHDATHAPVTIRAPRRRATMAAPAGDALALPRIVWMLARLEPHAGHKQAAIAPIFQAAWPDGSIAQMRDSINPSPRRSAESTRRGCR
jgi:hypothetical protein